MKGDKRGRSTVKYGDKVERIYRILLDRPRKKRTWYRIAKEADVSYGWAFKVLKGLEEKGILKGYYLKKPKRLFQIWAERHDDRRYREYHIQNIKSVLRKASLDFVLTSYFAENLLGNYLFPRSFHFYIHMKDASRWNRYLVANGYVGKGNVRIILHDEHVFFSSKKIEGWPIVSPQQLIVDLMREGAECAEAADLLIKRYYHD